MISIIGYLYPNIVNVDYYSLENKLQVVVEFDREISPSEVRFNWNDSRTVYYVEIENENLQSAFLPVSKGPLEGIQLTPTRNTVAIFFFTIVPVKADWYVVGNKIVVNFPHSVVNQKFSFSFLNAPLDVVIREFSRALGINISLYEGVRDTEVNLDVKNVEIEKALRLLFLNNPNVCYAYGPDGTLYLGLEDEIKNNFAMYWQIYDGEISAERIKALLSSGTFMNFLKDKSKVFVYGGIREHRLVSDAISVRPTKSWYYYSYTVDANIVENFLNNISTIYDFKYVVLASLKQVAIYANSEVANTVGYLVSTLKDVNALDYDGMIDVKVKYPERIVQVLESLNIPYKVFGGIIKVPSFYKEIVERLNNDRSIGNPYRMVFEDISLKTVKNAMDYLGISENNGKVIESNGKVFVTLFVTEEIYRRFNQFVEISGTKTAKVKVSDDKLKNVRIMKKFDDGSVLVEGKEKVIEELMKISKKERRYVVKLTPFDPPKDLIISMVDATPVFQSDYTIVFEGVDDSTISEIEKIRDQFGKQIVELRKIEPESKKILEDLFNVNVYELKDKVYIEGDRAKEAKDFYEKNIGTMYIEEVKVDIENFDEIKSIFNDLYNVTAKYYPLNNLLILKGEKNNVEQAKNFLSEYNLEKEVKLFNVPFSENIKVIIESVIPDSKVYDLNGKLLVFGDKNMFDEVEDLLMNVNQNNSIVEINTDIDNLEEFVKFNFGNKIEILRLNGKIFAKGNLNDLNVLKEKLRSFEQSFVSVENGKININVKDYNLKNLIDKIFSKFNLDIIFESEINKHVTLNVAEITLDDFINFLNEQGVNVRRKENIMYFNDNTKKIMVKNGLITINATNATIVEISRNVYPKFGYAVIVDSVDDDLNIVLNNATLKEFENILLKKVDITKEGSLVYIKPKGKVEEKIMLWNLKMENLILMPKMFH